MGRAVAVTDSDLDPAAHFRDVLVRLWGERAAKKILGFLLDLQRRNREPTRLINNLSSALSVDDLIDDLIADGERTILEWSP